MKTRNAVVKTTNSNTMAGCFRTVCVTRLLPVLLFLLLPAVVQAQYTYTTNNGAITITYPSCASGAVTIPSTINGLPVTSIEGGWGWPFSTGAFAGCTNLTSVTIPASVTSIGYGAFACENLSAITVDPSNSAYSSLAGVLFDKPQTTLIEFPAGIGGSYTIPASVTSIGQGAFAGCTSLTSVTIPDSVTSIPGGGPVNPAAFEGCTSLASVTIPDSVTSIGDLMFMGCGLTSVTIPDSVTSIGDGAFAYCTNLTSVTIGNSVTSIGDGVVGVGAFQECSSLTSVTIPASVSYMATFAFAECTNLTTVYFLGNAPGWIDSDDDEFDGDNNAIGYYLPGTSGWGTTIYGQGGIPTEMWIPGSLQVTITPAAAISAGAQWQVDGGTLQNSGAVVSGLSVGSHTVAFSTISGWTTPSNQTVSVSTDAFAIATATGTYVAILTGPSPFTTLYSFSAATLFNSDEAPINRDGANPQCGLILSGNALYGTAYYGGTNGNGTVFAVNTDGTGFVTLYSFSAATLFNSDEAPINRDGANPQGGLLLSGNTLYGTAVDGGTSGNGTVFAVNTNGTGFSTLYNFTGGSDGILPTGGLILSGNTLYGTAQYGGSGEYGTLFAINTNGTGFTNLHSFTKLSSGLDGTNSDGANPWGGLLLSGNTLYGAAVNGGSSGNGTVFKVNTNGTGFTILHSFSGPAYYIGATNSDGMLPKGGLILLCDTLYGTAGGGGSWGAGTVFAVSTDGTGFTTLYNFTGGSDGGWPPAGLILSANTLYGTAQSGGSSGNGTVFAVNTDGTGFTNLYSFLGPTYHIGVTNSDGALPWAGLILSSNTLYGTAQYGGSGGDGTVFALSLVTNQTTATVNVAADPSNGGTVSGCGAFAVGSSVQISASANSGWTFTGWSDGGAQTHNITVPSGGATYTAYFSQEPQTAVITVRANPSSGGTVSGGGAYLVGASVQISATANSGWTFTGWSDGGARTHDITVPSGDATYTANFTTTSCTYTLNATSVTLPAKGGSKSVKVKASSSDCSWIAASNDSFITITESAATMVKFSVPGNTNTTPLTGTLTIAGETFTVNQAAGGCTFKLSPKAGKLKAAGGFKTVKVNPNLSDCAWTAVSNDSFITITGGASGTGKGTVTYTVPANTNTTPVTGSISIGGQTFTVSQAGAK